MAYTKSASQPGRSHTIHSREQAEARCSGLLAFVRSYDRRGIGAAHLDEMHST